LPVQVDFQDVIARGEINFYTENNQSGESMSQLPSMSRHRLYWLIEAFETDIHDNLATYVLDHIPEREALGTYFENALRNSNQSTDDDAEVAEFLSLNDSFLVLKNWKADLPQALVDEIKMFGPHLAKIVAIRNRVMHPTRPLLSEDSADAWNAFENLTSRFWKTLNPRKQKLATEPDYQPVITPQEQSRNGRISNLPIAEYDETGLIGREVEVNAICELLLARRNRIVTIVGEGGIGKTAIATDVGNRLLDDPSAPFECVLFVTLKTERLDAAGIHEMNDAIRSVAGAEAVLDDFVRKSASDETQELATFLEAVPTLLIIDNLETVSSQDVLEFTDRLPENVQFLMTSRIGIGEVERRYQMGPLQTRDAAHLFRRMVQTRNIQNLMKLTDEAVNQIVANLRQNPASIRWYVLCVEAGKPPLDTLRDQKELVRYCVQSIFDAASDEAKSLLTILRVLNRPVTVQELSLYFDNEPFDSIRKWAQELSRGSLINYVPRTNGELASEITLSASAGQFMPSGLIEDPVTQRILEIEKNFRQDSERLKKGTIYNRWNPEVIRSRDATDEPAAYKLQLALSQSKAKDFTRANEYLESARELSPDFWEVDRISATVWAYGGEISRASSSYRAALEKAPRQLDKAIVAFFFANHLNYFAKDLESAIHYSRQAYELSEFDTGAAVQLGSYLTFMHVFDEAEPLLRGGQQSAFPKTQNKATLGLIELSKRRSEQALSNHDFDSAMRFAVESVRIGITYWEANSLNTESTVIDKTSDVLAWSLYVASKLGANVGLVIDEITELYELMTKQFAPFAQSKKWRYVEQDLGRLVAMMSESGFETPAAFSTNVRQAKSISNIGTVRHLDSRGFGFIATDTELAGDIYFTKGALVPDTNFELLATGTRVFFDNLVEEEKGRRALKVRLADSREIVS